MTYTIAQEDRRAFLLALGVTLVCAVALSWAARVGDPLVPDSNGYLAFAARWTSIVFGEGPLEQMALARTPGYPALLALLRAIDDSPGLVIAFQGLLFFADALLVAWWAQRGALARRGLWRYLTLSLLVLGTTPIMMLATLCIMTEQLFATLLLLLAMLLTPRLVSMAINWRLGVAGLLIGLLTLVRPIAQWLPLWLVPWVIFAFRRERGFGRALFVMLLASQLLVGAWCWRVQRTLGVWTPSTIGVTNLLHYRAAGILAMKTGRPIAEVKDRLRAEYPEAPRNRREFYEMSRAGAGILLHNPKLWAIQVGRALAMFLLDPGSVYAGQVVGLYPRGTGVASRASSAGLWSQLWTYVRSWNWPARLFFGFGVVQLAATYLLAVRGARGWARRERETGRWRAWEALGMPCILAAYLLLLSLGPEMTARFRLPALVLFAPIVVSGLYALWSHPGTRFPCAEPLPGSAPSSTERPRPSQVEEQSR